MTSEERAQRIAIWGWAAVTLGVEAGADRILGLVEVTASVRLENLKPALESVIRSEPQGFLPSPGAVIEAARRIAERAAMNRPRLERGEDPDHMRRWDAEHNPEGWDTETWRAHIWRMANDSGYARRQREDMTARHAWCDRAYAEHVGRSRVSHEYRINLRAELLRDSYAHLIKPTPWEGGFLMPERKFDPIGDLVRSKRIRRSAR